jgi:hypothetical protein
MTLQLIGRNLSQLTELLEEYQDELAFTDMQVVDRQAAIAEIEQAISGWIKAEVQKADNIAGYLRREEATLDAADREIEILKHRQVKRRERLAQFEQYVLEEMRVRGKKRIDGTVYSLRRRNSGGVLGVDVRQPELLPEDLVSVTWKLPAKLARLIVNDWDFEAHGYNRDIENLGNAPFEPNLTAIRKELEKREPCPACHGSGLICNSPENPVAIRLSCETCLGGGFVAAGVPGAVLKERGEHLRVEPA